MIGSSGHKSSTHEGNSIKGFKSSFLLNIGLLIFFNLVGFIIPFFFLLLGYG